MGKNQYITLPYVKSRHICVTFSMETGTSSPQIGNPQQRTETKRRPSLSACGVSGSREESGWRLHTGAWTARPRLCDSSESTSLELCMRYGQLQAAGLTRMPAQAVVCCSHSLQGEPHESSWVWFCSEDTGRFIYSWVSWKECVTQRKLVQSMYVLVMVNLPSAYYMPGTWCEGFCIHFHM